MTWLKLHCNYLEFSVISLVWGCRERCPTATIYFVPELDSPLTSSVADTVDNQVDGLYPIQGSILFKEHYTIILQRVYKIFWTPPFFFNYSTFLIEPVDILSFLGVFQMKGKCSNLFDNWISLDIILWLTTWASNWQNWHHLLRLLNCLLFRLLFNKSKNVALNLL